MNRNTIWVVLLIAALTAFSYVAGQRTQRGVDAEQMAAIEHDITVVHDTVTHYDTLLRVDTLRLRVAEERADTARDTAWVYIGTLDSAAKADSVVSAAIAHATALACSDAILSDSVALAAARTALRDCYAARTWSDSGRVLAERKAVLVEHSARWSGRRQGAAVGALATLLLVHLLK
jgi:hypothetical protein